MFLGVGFGMLLWCMDIKVEIDGEEIVVTKTGDGLPTCVSQRARQPEPRSHAKLRKAYHRVTRDKRISRPRFPGCSLQGARAWLGCVS